MLTGSFPSIISIHAFLSCSDKAWNVNRTPGLSSDIISKQNLFSIESDIRLTHEVSVIFSGGGSLNEICCKLHLKKLIFTFFRRVNKYFHGLSKLLSFTIMFLVQRIKEFILPYSWIILILNEWKSTP